MTITATDTLFTVSVKNLRSTRSALADLKACNLVADSLKSALDTCYSYVRKSKKLDIVNDSLEKYLKIEVQAKIISDSICQTTKKQHERKITWLKIQRNVEAIPAAIGVGTIIWAGTEVSKK